MTDTNATLHVNGQDYQLPIIEGTLGNPVLDIKAIPSSGFWTYDPGFMATAAVESKITYIDGDKGILLYRGYPIEQLAEQQKKMVKRFRKPFPYREISVIYYKPTYKQKILDELIAFIKESLSKKLNYNKDPENFVGIKPQ